MVPRFAFRTPLPRRTGKIARSTQHVAGTAFAQDATEPVAAEPATTSTVVGAESASTDSKFVIGLRLGYGIAIGKAEDIWGSSYLNEFIKGNIPIWLDLGYIVTPNILVGLYGMYGFSFRGNELSGDCDECSASMMRFGVQGQYHLVPSENIDPWFGLGIGFARVQAHSEVRRRPVPELLPRPIHLLLLRRFNRRVQQRVHRRKGLPRVVDNRHTRHVQYLDRTFSISAN
jgi:hypothetical protein